MNQVTDAFRRAANRGGPLFHQYETYRAEKIDLDVSDLSDEERRLVKSDKVTVYDWAETVPGALKWQDVGTDGTTDKGVLTLYAEPQVDAPDMVLASDGTYYIVKEALGQDTLRAAYRLEVSRWPGDAPLIRSAAL
jgi:hypothetical protein